MSRSEIEGKNAERIRKYIKKFIPITLEEKLAKAYHEEKLRLLILITVEMKQRTSLAATVQLTTVNRKM
jgi:hypothetical protein